jgi:lambda family phage portal protein
MIFNESFDGEKTPDELGPIKNYITDNFSLAARTKQAYLESDIAKTVVDRFVLWSIGSGLKFQAEPLSQLLNLEGVETLPEVESQIDPYWNRFANSPQADYSKEKSLHKLAQEATKTALLSGDCLVVGRLRDSELTFQLIDGQYLSNPSGMANNTLLRNNNRVFSGVEVNAKGQHVAYHVANDRGFGTRRIEAVGRQTGMRFAFLVTGVKYNSNDHRGIPLLTSSLETLAKLDRYKEATVSTAEEAAKLTFQITHEAGSSERNPFVEEMQSAVDLDTGGDQGMTNDEGQQLERQVYASTERKAVNLPSGAELKPMQHSNGEINFKDFYHPNIQLICSAANIPYEVAMQKYDSNFSASRAALKDWEHTLEVWREHIASQFYQPAFNLFFTQKVVNNQVQAPGYVSALVNGNPEVVEAYRNARWVGKSVPHIDPVKEIESIRRQLGPKAKHLPLTTLRKATEKIDNGEAGVNVEKLVQELQNAEQLGLSSESDSSEPSAESSFEEPE